jgi:photosystem II stability/assembly factor-like uncharacterized protein
LLQLPAGFDMEVALKTVLECSLIESPITCEAEQWCFVEDSNCTANMSVGLSDFAHLLPSPEPTAAAGGGGQLSSSTSKTKGGSSSGLSTAGIVAIVATVAVAAMLVGYHFSSQPKGQKHQQIPTSDPATNRL